MAAVSASRQQPDRLFLYAGGGLLGAACGVAVAFAGLNALILAAALVGSLFILRDFRVGVVLLIVLMPLSASRLFPHAMLGITGLNPLNLLLAATLGSCLLHGLFDGGIRRFLPRPLLWLYLVPLLAAGALGSRYVGDIAPAFYMYELLHFHDAPGYLRDVVMRPLLLVVFALLVAAAVHRSAQPGKFLIPALLSIWVMGLIVIVFVILSGAALGELARSDSRSFLSPLGMHANELGRLYAVAYALLLFTWAESDRPGHRLALLVSMALVVVALVLTFSRGAFFGFVVVNALFVLWRRDLKTLAFLALLSAAALYALPGAVYERIATGYGSGLDAMSAGRVEGIWLPLIPELSRSPIYGNGLGSILWSDVMRREGGLAIQAVGHPHNAYLQALLDMGVAGLILLCAYFVHVWKGLRILSVDPTLSPAWRGFYRGAMAGLASFLLAAVTDGSLAPRPEQTFLWLAIGMMYGQRTRG